MNHETPLAQGPVECRVMPVFDSSWRKACSVRKCSITEVDEFIRAHYLAKRPAIAAVAKHNRPVTATEIRREVAGYPGGPGSIAVRLAMTELVTTGRARSAVIEKDPMGCGTEGIGWELVPSAVAS